jgi:septal ring factor EnvC (AmiA/AmiB activator)
MLKHAERFFLISILLTISLHSTIIIAANKTEKPKENLNNIRERIESLTKELGKTKEAHADATDALKESEKAISESNRKLFELATRTKKTE